MRAAEVLGAVATVALAFIVLSALAGQSPPTAIGGRSQAA
jgi:hypothetical protein